MKNSPKKPHLELEINKDDFKKIFMVYSNEVRHHIKDMLYRTKNREYNEDKKT